MINIAGVQGSGVFKWTKDYLVKVLSSGKNPVITDPMLINAFLRIDRKDFVPEALKNKSYDDIELDIGYSEKLNRPTVIAQMLSLVKPKLGGKYLDIGTGTGFSAAVLAFVAGEMGHVYTIERVQWLWEQAKQNFQKYKNLKNIDLLYRDGIAGLVNQAPFDGIHIAFAMEEVPEKLKSQLKVKTGRLVCPTIDNNLRIIERTSLTEYVEEIVPGFIFEKAKEGLA